MAIKVKEIGNLTCEITCNTAEEWAKVSELIERYDAELLDFEVNNIGYCHCRFPLDLDSLSEDAKEIFGIKE